MTNRPLFDKFFQVMPLVFASAGVLMLLALRTWSAFFCGLVLIGFAGYELYRRNRVRHHRDAAESRFRLKLASILPPAPIIAVSDLVWDETLECGHPTIDEHHQTLFVIANKLIEAAQTEKSRAHIEFLLDALIEHINDHFVYEEAVMASIGLPLARSHTDGHRILSRKARTLCLAYKTAYVEIHQVLDFMVHELVDQHIREGDSALLRKAH